MSAQERPAITISCFGALSASLADATGQSIITASITGATLPPTSIGAFSVTPVCT